MSITNIGSQGPVKQEYLGDAVYVSFDGHNIILYTGDGHEQKIYLEIPVLDKLLDYMQQIGLQRLIDSHLQSEKK